MARFVTDNDLCCQIMRTITEERRIRENRVAHYNDLVNRYGPDSLEAKTYAEAVCQEENAFSYKLSNEDYLQRIGYEHDVIHHVNWFGVNDVVWGTALSLGGSLFFACTPSFISYFTMALATGNMVMSWGVAWDRRREMADLESDLDRPRFRIW